MNGYLERQLELLEEQQEKLNRKRILLDFIRQKERNTCRFDFEAYLYSFKCFDEILIDKKVETTEFEQLIAEIKEKFKHSGYGSYGRYLVNFPYRWVNLIIKEIRNGENGGN